MPIHAAPDDEQAPKAATFLLNIDGSELVNPTLSHADAIPEIKKRLQTRGVHGDFTLLAGDVDIVVRTNEGGHVSYLLQVAATRRDQRCLGFFRTIITHMIVFVMTLLLLRLHVGPNVDISMCTMRFPLHCKGSNQGQGQDGPNLSTVSPLTKIPVSPSRVRHRLAQTVQHRNYPTLTPTHHPTLTVDLVERANFSTSLRRPCTQTGHQRHQQLHQDTCQFPSQTINTLREMFHALSGPSWQACQTPWTDSTDVSTWCFVGTQGCSMYVELNGIAGLAGTIPPSIGSVDSQLQVLTFISNPHLSGTLPSTLGNLTQLLELVVEKNPILSGTLPPELGHLSQLRELSIDLNPMLSGTIPSSLGALSQLQILRLHSNARLEGTIPSTIGDLGRLMQLSLYTNPLVSGTIPASLGSLSQLQLLEMWWNSRVSGTIPSTLSNLSQLVKLALFANPLLSGTIPPSLGGLSQLQELLLFSNSRLSGTIPPEIGNLSLLRALGLYSNPSMSGTIPSSLNNLSELVELVLTNNSLLSGTIPELGSLRQLQKLGIYEDPLLSGTIPSTLGNLSELRVLGIYSNPRLSGTLPSSLGSLSLLQDLGLYKNPRLSGTIPASIGKLSQLIVLSMDLSSRISGTIPSSFGDLKSLQQLYIDSCLMLSGTIPPSLGNLTQLNTLSLNLNPLLSGTIPPSLGNLALLQTLSLATIQRLSGTIPPSLGNLQHLQKLEIFEDNLLSGTIPSTLGSLSQLKQLIVFSNPLLSGTIPSSIEGLVQLQGLILYSNPSISGTIPSTLSSLKQLTAVALQFNTLMSGTIPSDMDSLPLLNQIDFSSNPLLSGTIPSTFGNISQLNFLLLNSNPRLSGTIPPSLGGLSRLQTLGLYNNPLLSGTIPSSLGSLSQVQQIIITTNPLLSGTIPASLGTLSHLMILGLYNNPRLSGTIPPSLGNLAQIERLGLETNPRISGTIPPSLSKLSKLQQLYLSQNVLMSGTIPESIFRMNGLRLFNILELNRVSGTIPTINSTSLTRLVLSKTNISGELPSLTFAPSLQIVEITYTRVSGTVTESICDWNKIQVLDFSFNVLSGTLPACIAQLSDLHILSVSGNSLSGAFARVLPPDVRGAHFNLNPFTYAEDDCLSLNSTLEVLDLSDTELSTSFQNAASCYLRARLQVVRIRNASVSGVFDSVGAGDACSTLAEKLQLPHLPRIALSSLDVSSNSISGVFDMGLVCCNCSLSVPLLNRLPFLDTLSLSYTDIAVKALPIAAQSVQLVDVPEVTTDALLDILNSPVLQEANLHMLPPVQTETLSQLTALVRRSNQTVTYPVDLVTCPQWQTVNSGGNINIDLGLFRYQLCNCTQPTWYWSNSSHACKPCPSSRLRCDPALVQPIHSILPNYYPMFGAPCPQTSMLCLPQASFLPCLAAGVCSVDGPTVPRPADQPATLIAEFYCAVGHDPRSLLCSMCLPDYFLYGTSCGLCHTWAAALVPVMVLLFVVGYVYVLRRRVSKDHTLGGDQPTPRSQHEGSDDALSSQPQTISFTSLLIVFYWLQLVYLTTTETAGSASTAHGHVFGWLQSLAMFHPWGLDCTLPGLKRHHLELILTLPLTFAFAVCVCLYCYHLVRPMQTDIASAFAFSFQQTWELLYLPVCTAVFQSLTCQYRDGQGFLERAPYRSCGEIALTTLAVCTLLYFTCGYPLVNAHWRYRKAHDQHVASHARQHATKMWWWEPCVLRLRSVYVSVVVFTLPLQHPLIPLLIYIALLLNLLLQLHLAPYTDPANNRLSVVTLTSLLIIYLCTMIDDNSYSSASREVVIILTFTFTLFYAFVVLLPGLARAALVRLHDCLSPKQRDAAQHGGYLELGDDDVAL